jgi:hypothetical protein
MTTRSIGVLFACILAGMIAGAAARFARARQPIEAPDTAITTDVASASSVAADDGAPPPSCIERLRRLEQARRELEEATKAATRTDLMDRRDRSDADTTPWPDSVPPDLRPEAFEPRMQSELQRAGLDDLQIDCSEEPCLVFGSGGRETIESLAAALAAGDAFDGYVPVTVTRSVARGAGDIDIVSALALARERDGSADREATKRSLRSRLSRLQD